MIKKGFRIGICKWNLRFIVDKLFNFVDKMVTVTGLEKVYGGSICG